MPVASPITVSAFTAVSSMPDDDEKNDAGGKARDSRRQHRVRERKRTRNAAKAIASGDFDDDALTRVRALDNEAKELCQQVVIFGPEYLRQAKGWSAAAIRDFLGRREIVTEVEYLQKQYQDREGLQERTQFFGQLKVNAMVPAALNVLARALRGSYQDPQSGETVAPPGRGQYDAAIEVLNRANVQGSRFGGHDQVPQIDARTVNMLVGGSSEQLSDLDAEGREKVRNMLGGLLSRAKSMAAAGKRLRSADVATTAGATPQVVDDDEEPDTVEDEDTEDDDG